MRITEIAPPLYPLADRDRDGWYSDGDFEDRGGKIVWMSPDDYLSRVRPLAIDDSSRDNIDDLKSHIESGHPLDPLKIYSNGSEDGRHRAYAAKELGIAQVPVMIFSESRGSSNAAISKSQDVRENPAFRNWFRNSKVVNRDGSPMVVFHGTGHEFTAFDPDSEPYNYESDRGKFFFTSNEETAKSYSKNGGDWSQEAHKNPRVIAAYISLQNPYIIDNSDNPIEEWDLWGDLYARNAEERNSDGIIIHTENAREWLVIAFRPEQIKQIDNQTFNSGSIHMHEATRKIL